MRFLTRFNLFKTRANVSDTNAPRSLSCILKSDASTWWDGIKDSVPPWNDAIAVIKSTYSPPDDGITKYFVKYSEFCKPASSQRQGLSRRKEPSWWRQDMFLLKFSSWTSFSTCFLSRYARE